MKGTRKVFKRLQNYFIIGLALSVLGVPGIAQAQEQTQEPEKHCYMANIQTLPVQFNGFQPIIEASVDGEPIKMLVDSGSFATQLFQHAVDRLSLRMVHSYLTGSGVGGQTDNYRVHANEIKIGPLQGKNKDLQVIRQYGSAVGLDGLVGADILFQMDLEMSLAGRYLKFYTSSGCDDTPLSYWDESASVVHLDVGATLNGQPEIDVFINGKKVRAMVDSGAGVSIIDLRTAARLGVTPDSPNVKKAEHAVQGIGEKRSDGWIASFDEIKIGEESIKGARIEIGDLNGAAEMLLGADFLRSHRVLFSAKQSRMYFSYIGGHPFRTGVADDLTWYKASADKGDPDAQYNLAQLYLDGSAVPRDVTQAISLFQKAAEQGDHRAQTQLGDLFTQGEGIAKDPTQAFDWYHKAADGGDIKGQLGLAKAYEKGIGVEKNIVQAIGWYKKAAEQGNDYAQIRMGAFYLQGKGVSKDEDSAHEWLSKAVKDDWAGQHWYVGEVLFDQGMYPESASALRQAVRKYPSELGYSLWLYLAQARDGREEGPREELAAGSTKWKDSAWHLKIADFYLARITADELMKSAHDTNKKIEAEQTCEANFYVAEKYLINRDTKKAKPLLQAAEHDCPRNFIEYNGALAELEQMSDE